VADESAIGFAAGFGPDLWDAIILDSVDSATGRTGATGRTHDWSISARIAANAKVPVILAGGLNPANVSRAILTARPNGVDAHTGLENADGSRSFEKIRQFAEAALRAFAIIA
jgi:phosphoribosylanthranilate isomerase